MTVYYNRKRSIFLIYKIIFRYSFLRIIKFTIKFILSKKIKTKCNYNYAAFSHERRDENRVYGIIKTEKGLYFFKHAQFYFESIISNQSILSRVLLLDNQRFYDLNYKHRIITRKEFESLGFGINKIIYHGDLSKENILIFKDDIILIDDEFSRSYNVVYQNLDYMINSIGKSSILKKEYNLDFWVNLLGIYDLYTKEQVYDSFIERDLNGCDYSKKVLKYNNL